MKKIIASTVVAAATLSASQAAVFNGYSVGLNGGVSLDNLRINTIIGNTDNTKARGVFGIQFDYDYSRANCFYWGLGLDFMGSSGTEKRSAAAQTGANAAHAYIFERKRTWQSEVDARFGYNFNNQVAAYGLVGFRAYHFKYKVGAASATASATTLSISAAGGHVDKTKFAPVFGAGVKVKVADRISTGLEYRYAPEQTYRIDNVAARMKQHSHQILAKVSYHF